MEALLGSIVLQGEFKGVAEWQEETGDGQGSLGEAMAWLSRTFGLHGVVGVATVMADKVQGYSDYPAHVPGNAYTQDPGPTPHAYDNYYDSYNATGGVGYPERSQVHPGES